MAGEASEPSDVDAWDDSAWDSEPAQPNTPPSVPSIEDLLAIPVPTPADDAWDDLPAAPELVAPPTAEEGTATEEAAASEPATLADEVSGGANQSVAGDAGQLEGPEELSLEVKEQDSVGENLVSCPLTSLLYLIIHSCVMLLIGGVYFAWQMTRADDLFSTDIVFLLLLATSSLLLAFLMFYLPRWFSTSYLDFFSRSTDDEEEARALTQAQLDKVFRTDRMIMLGCVWALGVGSVPFSPLFDIMSPTSPIAGSVGLNALLGLFLAFANFLGGVALYCLLVYFVTTYRFSQKIELKLSDIDNPRAEFLLQSNFQISAGVSLYVTISIASILFSHMELGTIIYAYSIFSASIIFIAFMVPTRPLANAEKAARATIEASMHAVLAETVKPFEDGSQHVTLTQEQRENVTALVALNQMLHSSGTRMNMLVRKVVMTSMSMIPAAFKFLRGAGFI